jgi:hypothetical protein
MACSLINLQKTKEPKIRIFSISISTLQKYISTGGNFHDWWARFSAELENLNATEKDFIANLRNHMGPEHEDWLTEIPPHQSGKLEFYIQKLVALYGRSIPTHVLINNWKNTKWRKNDKVATYTEEKRRLWNKIQPRTDPSKFKEWVINWFECLQASHMKSILSKYKGITSFEHMYGHIRLREKNDEYVNQLCGINVNQKKNSGNVKTVNHTRDNKNITIFDTECYKWEADGTCPRNDTCRFRHTTDGREVREARMNVTIKPYTPKTNPGRNVRSTSCSICGEDNHSNSECPKSWCSSCTTHGHTKSSVNCPLKVVNSISFVRSGSSSSENEEGSQ